MNSTNSVPVGLDSVPGLNLLPHSWQGPVLLLVALHPYLTRAFYSLKNGGGVKGVVASIWLGTPTPAPAPKA